MPKTVLITGAGAGIGKETALLFRTKGWNVVATMRAPERSAGWAEPAGLFCPTLDVTDEDAIKNAVRETVQRFGTIDVVVNNAGYGLTGPLEGILTDQLERQFRTNVFGLMTVTRHVLPVLRQQGGGTIVNVSSIGGRIAFPFASAYHATKFAVEGLSESLRFELKPFGIRVKVVEPGGIKTDFITRSQEWAKHPAYEPALGEFIRMTGSLNDNLPGPESVAKVVYRAAIDGSHRLRYPAKPGPYLLLHSLLPDRIWQSVVGSFLKSHASGASTRALH